MEVVDADEGGQAHRFHNYSEKNAFDKPKSALVKSKPHESKKLESSLKWKSMPGSREYVIPWPL